MPSPSRQAYATWTPPPGFRPVPSKVPGIEIYAPAPPQEEQPGAKTFTCPQCNGIIAYSDNDCLYHRDWLPRSLELLETFPNAGMVTSRPFRTPPEFYSRTVGWAEATEGAQLERGDFIPFEVFREFDRSLAQSDEEIRAHYESSEDVRLRYKDVEAIAGASHWQFVAYKSVLSQFLFADTGNRPHLFLICG